LPPAPPLGASKVKGTFGDLLNRLVRVVFLTLHHGFAEGPSLLPPTEMHPPLKSRKREHMSTVTYSEILSHIQRLTPADQLRLLEELAVLVRHQIAIQPRRSILELQGLGKDIWSELEPQEYVDRERASWNG